MDATDSKDVMMKLTPRVIKFFPLILIVLFSAVFLLIKFTKPSAQRSSQKSIPVIEVEVIAITPGPFQIVVKSYGLTRALTQTTLVSRVSGEVEFVDESFRQGGFFSQNQLLVTLDQSDYIIELDIATAQVAEAQSRYASEQAQAEEARHDWTRSGRLGEPPALAVRQPQLDAAAAALKSANAGVARAKLNLSRTEIRAPYDGSVIESIVGRGQFVQKNLTLAEIFSMEAAEIPLPIKNTELNLLGLSSTPDKGARLAVTITSTLFGKNLWQGEIVRVASAIDEQSRQLNVIARIPFPFARQKDGRAPLKIGEYVTAQILGKTLQNAITIPSSSIYQGRYVYLFKNGQVRRHEISIQWTDQTTALISRGLNQGDQLVITALGQVSSGTQAKLVQTRKQKE